VHGDQRQLLAAHVDGTRYGLDSSCKEVIAQGNRWMRSRGVQAIRNTAPDLPPVPVKYPTMVRDHEYIRLGTRSILASLELHDGHVIARVEERHRSIGFIGLLKELDAYYPPGCTIRLILDNHSAHTSKETRAYLATRPDRFRYVLTPTHGSWLNLAETLFGTMGRVVYRIDGVEIEGRPVALPLPGPFPTIARNLGTSIGGERHGCRKS